MKRLWPILTASFLTGCGALQTDCHALQAGMASMVITPEQPGQFLAGLDQNRRAEGVHDDIYARCLVLDDGANRVALCALDLIGLLRADVKDIVRRVTRVPPDHVLIACTHTHSGPDTIGLWGADSTRRGVDEAYLERVKQLTAQCIDRAAERLRPASLRWAVTSQPPDTSKNFREEHILDRTLLAIQAVGEDGKVIGTLINWACHPEVLWDDNKLITSDYVGYLRSAVEARQGGIAIFFNGALGGMVSPAREVHTFEEAQRFAEAAAGVVNQALAQPTACVGTLRIVSKDIKIPLENLLLRGAALAGIVRVEDARREEVETRVTVLMLGDLPMVTIPGEALPAVGLALREHWSRSGHPTPLAILGLTHDELGYILPPRDWERELYEYERSMSVGRQTAVRVVEAIAELLGNLVPETRGRAVSLERSE